MRTLHALLDVNNDGVISYDDFQVLAQNFTSLGHLTPEAEQEFREVLKTIWETQWGEISPYNLVNAEQYLAEMHHAVNDKSQRERIHQFLPYLFKVSTIGLYCFKLKLRTSTHSTVFLCIFSILGGRQRSFRFHFARRIQAILRMCGSYTRRCGRLICCD